MPDLIPEDVGTLSLDQIQALQAEIDRHAWVGPADHEGKRRHILFHLVSLVGKLARQEERRDHGAEREPVELEAIPDLLIFASQLAELSGESLASLYRNRVVRNTERFARVPPRS